MRFVITLIVVLASLGGIGYATGYTTAGIVVGALAGLALGAWAQSRSGGSDKSVGEYLRE